MVTKEYKPLEMFINFIFIFIVGFIVSYIIFKDVGQEVVLESVNIPSSDQIYSFCQARGYDYGWLSSSSCEMNEVNCHKKYGTLVENICVRWE